MADSAFQGYFRCPAEFSQFDVSSNLSAEREFFNFDGATGFGRTDRTGEGPSIPAGRLGAVSLSFDLTDVATSLRQERYTGHSQPGVENISAGAFAREFYYFLRPALPVAIRRHLQKVRLSGWDKIEFPRWPVDFSVDTLMQSAMRLQVQNAASGKVPFIWFWPDRAPSAAILTHDVESKSGVGFCRGLMDLDDEYGFKSSFQVVPEKRYEPSDAICDLIRARGFEVNVHDLNHDGRLFQTREQFLERAARINAYGRQRGSAGFRSAAMYRKQDWFDALEFSYDMSVPNVAHLEPQRGGCCTVMPYFIGKLVELPLTTIQDYSLFNILDDYSIDVWKTQIDLIRAANGLVTLLSHPDYLIEERPRSIYRQLLAHVRRLCEAQELWCALPGDVVRWWRYRSEMTLVQSRGEWHVEGTGSDRASVAFASVRNGQVVHEVDGRIMRSVTRP